MGTVDNHAQRATPDRWKTPVAVAVGHPSRFGVRSDVLGHAVPRLPSSRARSPGALAASAGGSRGLLAGAAASGQDTRAGSAQATRTTVRWIPGALTERWHLGLRAPPGAATSRRGRRDLLVRRTLPFIATRAPVGATSGIDQPSSRSRGATARDVTTSNVRSPCSASARPRTTSTWSSPRVATTSSRNVVRRSSGSTSVIRRSGRAMASTRPGSRPRSRCRTRWPPRGPARQHGAVEQVPLPQAGRLPRADQARGPRRRWPAARRTAASGEALRTRTPSATGRGGVAGGGCFT